MVKLVGLTNLVCDDSIFSGFLGIPAGQYPRILFGGKISSRYPWSLFGGGTFSSSKICDAFPGNCSILTLLKKDEFTEQTKSLLWTYPFAVFLLLLLNFGDPYFIKTNKRRSPKFNSKRPWENDWRPLFGMIKFKGPTVKLPGENITPPKTKMTMENPSFEDLFPFEHGHFPMMNEF